MGRRCSPRPATWRRWMRICAQAAGLAPSFASLRRFRWTTDLPTSMLPAVWAAGCASLTVRKKPSTWCATQPRANHWRFRSSLLVLPGRHRFRKVEGVPKTEINLLPQSILQADELIKDQDGVIDARCLDGPPVMPARVQVLVFGQVVFFEVDRSCMIFRATGGCFGGQLQGSSVYLTVFASPVTICL